MNGTCESRKHQPPANDQPALVVDDDHDLQIAILAMLAYEGFAAETATNGREALDRVQRRRPSFVLLDRHLPDLDGDVVAREILARFGTRVPIVLMSADTDIADVAEQAGAAGFLLKPFTVDDIHTTLQQVGMIAESE